MIRATKNRVILKKEAAPEKKGLLIMPTETNTPCIGVVVGVGPLDTQDGHINPPAIKMGDRVVYNRFAAQALNIDGQDLLVINENEIYAILEA